MSSPATAGVDANDSKAKTREELRARIAARKAAEKEVSKVSDTASEEQPQSAPVATPPRVIPVAVRAVVTGATVLEDGDGGTTTGVGDSGDSKKSPTPPPKLTSEERERLRARVEARKAGKGPVDGPTVDKPVSPRESGPVVVHAVGRGARASTAEKAVSPREGGTTVVHAVGRGARASMAENPVSPREGGTATTVVHAVGRGSQPRASTAEAPVSPRGDVGATRGTRFSTPNMTPVREAATTTTPAAAEPADPVVVVSAEERNKSWRASLKERLGSKGGEGTSPTQERRSLVSSDESSRSEKRKSLKEKLDAKVISESSPPPSNGAGSEARRSLIRAKSAVDGLRQRPTSTTLSPSGRKSPRASVIEDDILGPSSESSQDERQKSPSETRLETTKKSPLLSKRDSVTPDGQKKLALALDRANTSPDLFAASRADIFGDAPSLKPVAATPSSSRPSSQTGPGGNGSRSSSQANRSRSASESAEPSVFEMLSALISKDSSSSPSPATRERTSYSSGEESGVFDDSDDDVDASKRDPRVTKKVERLSLVYDMLKNRVEFGGAPLLAWDNDFRSLCAEWEVVRTRGPVLQQRDTDVLFTQTVALWMAYRLSAPCFSQKVPAVFHHCDVGERILVSYLGLDGLGWGDHEQRAKQALRSLRSTRRKAVTSDTKLLTALAVRQQLQLREMQAIKKATEEKQKRLLVLERKVRKNTVAGGKK